MESVLSTFLTWQAVLFTFGIYVTTFILRRSVEGTWPFLSNQPGNAAVLAREARLRQLWEGVALRVLPPVLGVVCAFLTSELMHPGVHSHVGKAFYGMVCGFSSSYAYLVVKAILKKGFDIRAVNGREGDSVRPPSDPVTPSDPPPEDDEEEAPPTPRHPPIAGESDTGKED